MVDIVEMKYLITNSLKFHLNQLYLTTHTIVLMVITLINDLTKPSDVYENINSMDKNPYRNTFGPNETRCLNRYCCSKTHVCEIGVENFDSNCCQFVCTGIPFVCHKT